MAVNTVYRWVRARTHPLHGCGNNTDNEHITTPLECAISGRIIHTSSKLFLLLQYGFVDVCKMFSMLENSTSLSCEEHVRVCLCIYVCMRETESERERELKVLKMCSGAGGGQHAARCPPPPCATFFAIPVCRKHLIGFLPPAKEHKSNAQPIFLSPALNSWTEDSPTFDSVVATKFGWHFGSNWAIKV